METSRFFVADLPTNTTERDLQLLFQDYGQINNIELKSKKNLVDPDDIQLIAFVTLNIGAQEAQYCLNDIKWQKVRGQKIRVSFAKESFMERLKREREEAQTGCNAEIPLTERTFEEQSDLLKLPQENKRRTFDIDAELDDDEVAAELMISKKRAASSMHNGKIVIQQCFDVEPIHVIESKHKRKKQNDSKTNSADQKRKESLNKMKSQYEQNKIAIQQALQGENAKVANKIKFSDAESEAEDVESSKKGKTDLFTTDGEESEDEANGFPANALGKKGEKLARMQAKQSLDPRFRIDAKFVDEDDDENDKTCAEGDEPESERQWQMNILEQVVGRKLDTVKSADKLKQNKKMLRYDPSKDEHQKFERSNNKEADTGIKESKKKDSKTKTDSSQPAEVSKEVFYVVSDTLQQTLRSRGEGFSLLNMFGRTEQLEQRDEQLKQLGKEKILVNSNKTLTVNPFNYDSSSDSENEEQMLQEEQDNNVGGTKKIVTNEQENNKKMKKKRKLLMESFFIPKNDIRLKEGAKFFIYRKSEDAANENYEEVRNRLKLLIKSKITKTKKNLANAGYKGKRKVY